MQYFYILWCCSVSQPSYKTSSVSSQEDVAAARDHIRSGRSQLAAEVPVSAVSSGRIHSGESIATSSSKHRPASTLQPSQTQRHTSSDQQLPPSGKQRLICSVEVPGIGRAAKVDYVKYIA